MNDTSAQQSFNIQNQTQRRVPQYSAAIELWISLLGAARCLTEQKDIAPYGRSCGHPGNLPTAVLFPRSTAEVSKILAIAQSEKVPVYPISRGKNSGYGSASPSVPNCVVMDLRLMNRIISVNEELAYAVVEPGVTQQQLFEYLRDSNSRLWVDVTGASPQSSLIGNLVERGYGLSPAGDRFANSCGMEVVLPDGEVIETGFGHILGEKVSHLHRMGIGPALDGIFTQSNLGVITRVGLWLMPRPDHAEIVSIQFQNDEIFSRGVERLRELKLRGLFPSPVHLANDLRVISVFEQYPFDVMQGQTPLSEAVLAQMKRKWQVGAWNCVAGLWGTRKQVKMMKAELRAALRGVAKPQFVSRSLVNFIAPRKWLHWLPGAEGLDRKMGLLRLLEGTPSSAPQNAGYWRKRTMKIPQNPDLERDNCGVIWVSPIVPSTATEIQKFIEITRSTCREFGFETNVTVSLTTDRVGCCTVAILFDPEIASEQQSALSAHEALLERYLATGFPPYRAGSDWGPLMTKVMNPERLFVTTCRRLKRALDPAGILAPHRYGI